MPVPRCREQGSVNHLIAAGGQARAEDDAGGPGPARTRLLRAAGPTWAIPTQLVSFGTSGHRGSPLQGSFTEAHILAITQAICDYRRGQGHRRPALHGQGHARAVRAGPAHRARGPGRQRRRDRHPARTTASRPTPVISRAILVYNRGRTAHLADGIVITPSHNPPEDGGFKYNPPNGGPADTDVTGWIQDRANELLRAATPVCSACRLPAALKAATTHQEDFVLPYVDDLSNVVDMDAIRGAGLKLGVDPLGGASPALLGADQRRVRAGRRRRQPGDRPDLLVHDGRSRRQDPHGLLEPVRDGRARRAEGPVPRRLRQRPGRGPARHRDAARRA